MAATVLRKDHGMTRFSQEVVVFWAALFYSGFAAIGAERNLVGGNSKQEGIEELALAIWLGVSGVNRVGKVMKTVESSLEGEPSKWDVINQGGALHHDAVNARGNRRVNGETPI